jgi:hypothetical protein
MRNRDSSSRYEAMQKASRSGLHTQLTPEILLSTTADKEDRTAYSFTPMI